MPVRDRYSKNKDISIHYLETTDYSHNLTPLVYVPGALGFAEHFEDEMKILSPRHCVSLSLRGNGKSDAPLKGYTLEDHVSDIEAAIKESRLKDYCLMAYSMGVPYAIQYASNNPEYIKGMILLDYPAKFPSIPESWVDTVFSKGYIKEDRQHVVRGIQRDSEEVELWEDLQRIKCPVLIIKGGTNHSLLKERATEKYKGNLSNVKVVEFSDSGHELWIPDYNRFIKTVTDFLVELDRLHK
ncbi:alpha/beta fold hydrolase [Sutcliffiella horikoshii]